MYIHLVTPFKFNWIEFIAEQFKDCEFKASNIPDMTKTPDVLIFAWADYNTAEFINNQPKKSKYIVCVRAYDFYEGAEAINWAKVDAVYCVNDYIADCFEYQYGRKPDAVIYNGVDLNMWKFKQRSHGNKIAMVSFIHHKKNHALALQILNKLPENYELHCAGDIQCQDVVSYLDNLAQEMNRKVYIYGHIDQIDLWLEDKNYILCTSMREGSPNNIIEAMAKGIKPIIHNFPGAREQFGSHVFNTIEDAVNLIQSKYNSDLYLSEVKEKFSVNNYKKLRGIVETCQAESLLV